MARFCRDSNEGVVSTGFFACRAQNDNGEKGVTIPELATLAIGKRDV
jgi:hypothetical protein